MLDILRGAGGITGALFTLSSRNARDISDAMRSRGF
jgi:cobalt/nickel transport system permease protein